MEQLALVYDRPSSDRVMDIDHLFLCATDYNRKDPEEWRRRTHPPNARLFISSNDSSNELSSKKEKVVSATSWLDDLQIANLLHILLHQPSVHCDKSLVCDYFYPMASTLFFCILQSGSSERLKRVQAEQMILFCCIGGNGHWRLVILDGLKSHAVLFDSFGVAFAAAEVSMLRKTFTGYRIIDLKTAIQTDSYNCGVWCLYLAQQYLKQRTKGSFSLARMDGTIDRITRIRAEYMNLLLEHEDLPFNTSISEGMVEDSSSDHGDLQIIE
jgi:hypothetical protein